MNRTKRGRSPGLMAAFVALVLLGVYITWDLTRVYPTPLRISNGYEPLVGDIVFQSLPRRPLIAMIEDTTHSPLFHCGIVALDRGRWVVIEASGPVRETPLERWVHHGRRDWMQARRLKPRFRAAIPPFVTAARGYLGRAYDTRFDLKTPAIHCSDLIYKALDQACGERAGRLAVALRELDWRPHEALIRRLEGGPPPLERLLITPRDLARASQFDDILPVPIHSRARGRSDSEVR